MHTLKNEVDAKTKQGADAPITMAITVLTNARRRTEPKPEQRVELRDFRSGRRRDEALRYSCQLGGRLLIIARVEVREADG